MKFINIGFRNMVSMRRSIAIINPDSSPTKRIIHEARKNGNLIDATCGRKTRSVIIIDSGHIVLSAIQPETISNRFINKNDNLQVDEDNSNDK